jgi:hypothetical protein
MEKWLARLSQSATAGGYTDCLEVQWIRESIVSSWDQLADSGGERWKALDLILATRKV